MVTTFTHDGTGTSATTWTARPEWQTVARLDLSSFDRVVVLAAHPDDETLGAGGLIATAAAAGLDVEIAVVTAGEHSHPNSTTHPPAVLAKLREAELRAAVHELAPTGALTLLDLEDGHVAEHEQDLVEHLVRGLGDARRTVLVAPWRHDGHPDHEAAGRAAATAAHRTGALLWEYPIWWWHWSSPADAPWADLRRLELSPDAVLRRERAMAHHRSQTEPLSDAPGDEVLLQPQFLEHFTGGHDRFFVQPTGDAALDLLHLADSDPWAVDHRWYERRKRALCLALLPRERFVRGLEVGCSIGALTAELTERCTSVVAIDSSAAAVTAARRRLAPLGADVDLRHEQVPGEWPGGRFDLVVISEVGYFLSPRDLDGLVERIRHSLTPDGVVLLCHWRHPIRGWPLDAAAVHATFEASGLRPTQARYVETDFEVVVLASDEAWAGADR